MTDEKFSRPIRSPFNPNKEYLLQNFRAESQREELRNAEENTKQDETDAAPEADSALPESELTTAQLHYPAAPQYTAPRPAPGRTAYDKPEEPEKAPAPVLDKKA